MYSNPAEQPLNSNKYLRILMLLVTLLTRPSGKISGESIEKFLSLTRSNNWNANSSPSWTTHRYLSSARIGISNIDSIMKFARISGWNENNFQLKFSSHFIFTFTFN